MGATAVPYVGAISLFLWVLVFASAVELVALHLVLPWESVRLMADVLGIWGLLWLLGFTASNYVYPHLLTEKMVVLRSGHSVEITVPLDAVVGASTRERSHKRSRTLRVQGGVLSVVVASRTNVDLRLSCPLSVPVGRSTVEVTEIRFFADEPRALVRQVTQRLSARSDGSR
ncbi:MAG: hypothetical protein ABIQ15_14225 [Nocardioides sp.]